MPTTYPEVYSRWLAAPERFWAEAAEAVDWYRTWDAVLDDSRSPSTAGFVAASSTAATTRSTGM